MEERERKPPKVIFVGGAQGVGKSHLADVVVTQLGEELKKDFPNKTPRVEHFKFGEELKKITSKRFGTENLRQLKGWQLIRAHEEVVNRALASDCDLLLVDGHYSRNVLDRVSRNLTPYYRKLDPHVVHFILIEAPETQVRQRIVSDKKENRRTRRTSPAIIRRSIVSQRFVARARAEENNRRLTIVRNENHEQAARTLKRIAKLFLKKQG